MKVFVYEDRGGEWRWRAVDGNNRIIADGAEGYVTRDGALQGLDNVMNEFRGDVEVLTKHEPKRAQHSTDTRLEGKLALDGVVYDTAAEYQAEGAK